MKQLLAALAFSILAFATVDARAQAVADTTPLDGIAAIVDEDIVLKSEVDRDVTRVMAQYATTPQQLPPRDILERQVLDRLISQKLQLARADSTGVKVSDAEVDQALGQIAAQNHLDVSQLRGAIESQGMDYDQFRRGIREQLVVSQLRQRVAQSRTQISDAEIDSLIRNGSVGGGQVHIGYIVVGVPDGATPDQIDEARRKADEAKAQIDGGMDFAAAAIRYSNADNALQGGDLGWRSRNELPPAFTDATDNMKDGEVTAPMRGPNGFYLVKLFGKRDEGSAQMVTEYHARHILIKPSELVSEEQAKHKIDGVRQKIVQGEDFEQAAKENSEDDKTARLGGDLGWFAAGAYGQAVTDVIKDMKPGDLSQPFQTTSGWHLLQLVDTRQSDKAGELQRDQARNILYQRKAEDEYESFLRQLRSEAYIEIRMPGAASDKPAAP